ncbi:MAG: molybdopterin-dependent oxidoreductase [Pseudomonadales bacterium]|nr:molybdopterin-dependent oxidoreductase [Pseudomonadales bacterium]
MKRRLFLKLSLTVSGALQLGMPVYAAPMKSVESANKGYSYFHPYLEITPQNQVICFLSNMEMGQSVIALYSSLVASALNYPIEKITFELPQKGPGQLNPEHQLEPTGGSRSTIKAWANMRPALLDLAMRFRVAASQTLSVDIQQCLLKDGYVAAGSERIAISELAPRIDLNKPLSITSDSSPDLPLSFPQTNHHWKEVVTGKRQYGIDYTEGAEIVVVARPHALGAKLKSYDASKAKAVAGVNAVFEVPTGIAVAASNVWSALQGRDKLDIKWGTSDTKGLSDSAILDTLSERIKAGEGATIAEQGAPLKSNDNLRSVSVEYRLPFLAHAPMEPLTCTIERSDSFCEIWSASQKPTKVIHFAQAALGLPASKIRFNNVYAGGSFGRRLSIDYIVEALMVSYVRPGKIQLFWDKEDTITQWQYRPPAVIKMTALLDSNNQLIEWRHETASPGKLSYQLPIDARASTLSRMKALAKELVNDVRATDYSPWVQESPVVGDAAMQGCKPNYLSSIANYQVVHHPVDLQMLVGFWRSVGNGLNNYAIECFMQTISDETKIDPIALRLKYIENPVLQNVLTKLRDISGWQQRAAGEYQGIACFSGYGTHCATVATIRKDVGSCSVSEFHCVVDCGVQINPDNVRAQIEGSLLMGLSAALYEKISLQDGRPQNRNYDRYQILRSNNTPKLTISVIDSKRSPGGIGEPIVPTVAPAIANAISMIKATAPTELPLMADLETC